MPICNCGCNKNISRRAIINHQRNHAIPRLVTAVVRASRAQGPVVSPPRLNPSKKLRSSRSYYPSSPEPALVNDNVDYAMSEADTGANLGDMNAVSGDELLVDDVATQRAINHTQADIWSGQHHSLSDNEEDEEADVEAEDSEDGPDAKDGWRLYDDPVDCEGADHRSNFNGLSALDMLREEFERNAVANGMFS